VVSASVVAVVSLSGSSMKKLQLLAAAAMTVGF